MGRLGPPGALVIGFYGALDTGEHRLAGGVAAADRDEEIGPRKTSISESSVNGVKRDEASQNHNGYWNEPVTVGRCRW